LDRSSAVTVESVAPVKTIAMSLIFAETVLPFF